MSTVPRPYSWRPVSHSHGHVAEPQRIGNPIFSPNNPVFLSLSEPLAVDPQRDVAESHGPCGVRRAHRCPDKPDACHRLIANVGKSQRNFIHVVQKCADLTNGLSADAPVQTGRSHGMDGSPGRIRTSDLTVNSRPLYRLSYRGACASRPYLVTAWAREIKRRWPFEAGPLAIRTRSLAYPEVREDNAR